MTDFYSRLDNLVGATERALFSEYCAIYDAMMRGTNAMSLMQMYGAEGDVQSLQEQLVASFDRRLEELRGGGE